MRGGRAGIVRGQGTHRRRRAGRARAAAHAPGIGQRRSGTTTFELPDRLGTSIRQTSASASTQATRTYDAFGLLTASTGTPQGPFGFAGTSGYQEDGDSGLKLLGHRYYDPSTGRFLTRDPVQDGRNWYAYCDSNPLRFTDNDGEKLKLVKGPGTKKVQVDLFWRTLIQLLLDPATHDMIIRLINDPTEYTIVLNPGGGTKVFPGTMLLDPTSDAEYQGQDGQYHQFSWPGVLSHELNHLVNKDHDEQHTVDTIERPVEKRKGFPPRGPYDPVRPVKPYPLLPGPPVRLPFIGPI